MKNDILAKIEWYRIAVHGCIEIAAVTQFGALAKKHPLFRHFPAYCWLSDQPMPCWFRQSRSHLSTVVGFPSIGILDIQFWGQ
jgi:hypothetical protein